MKKLLTLLSLVAIGSVLSACGQSSAIAPTSQENVSSGVLQFAVGSANIAGVANGGLNVVVTYRQPSNGYHPGDSATLLNEPSITLPSSISGITPGIANPYDPCSASLTGRGSSESGDVIMSTGQAANEPCGSETTTFGQSGGAFGEGIEPWNAVGAQQYEYACCIEDPTYLGAPYQVAPYTVPLWDVANATCPPCDPNSFTPWGGPPAFHYSGFEVNGEWTSPVGSGNTPGVAGIPLGIDVFDGIGVTAGAYTLSVLVPANTGLVTQSKSTTATVNNLGPAAAPVFTPDGTGGGTFAVTMPTGATEAFVEAEDGNSGVYYTMVAETSGATSSCSSAAGGTATCTLQDDEGPGGTPSVASGDRLAVTLIGFDYPAYEMSYPLSNGDPAPTITTSGTDDITISPAACNDVGGGDCSGLLPLEKRKGGQSVHKSTTTTTSTRFRKP